MTDSSATRSAARRGRRKGAKATGVKELLERYRASEELAAARRRLDAAATSESRLAAFASAHGASLSFFLAALLRGEDGPTLVLTATQEEAEDLRDELEEFSSRPALFFPPWESLFHEDSDPDEEIYHDRLRVLKFLEAAPRGELCFVVAPIPAILQPVASTAEISASVLRVVTGEELPRDELAARLTSLDFRHMPLVLRRGEYSVRGDILDVFPYDATHPLRVEFFGDTVESLREFDAESQRSLRGSEIRDRSILLPSESSMFRPCFTGSEDLLLERFGDLAPVVLVEPALIEERIGRIFASLLPDDEKARAREEFDRRLGRLRRVRAYSLALEVGAEGENLDLASVERFRDLSLDHTFDLLETVLQDGQDVTVYCDSDAERRRIHEILADRGVTRRDEIGITVGPVHRGFDVRAISTLVLTTGELFNRRTVRRSRRLQVKTQAIRGFYDLEEGDIVVHISHGIGRFLGVRLMEKEGVTQEFLEIEYRNRVKVYVPASKIDVVQKYIGGSDHAPRLDRVGGSSWGRRKESVESAVMDFAEELLEIQALRQARPGFAYPEDTEWQREFEAAFPFDDTPDQHEGTLAVKSDLQVARPMDRLLCGDVGYGKTEIAMRVAFKVVEAGKQVAVLVPTTVLAQQHCRTFRERMGGFPIVIEQLSRFCTPKEQRQIVEATAQGRVDILIGTHRILSDDVRFGDLGMVVIDEEQRFGVAHKEKLKRMRATVEVLTLTATPIPRTLHMALLGIRDISNLTTPPEGRSPIRTELIESDRPRIREAIIRELNRDGQVYFVHNRVQDIRVVRSELRSLVPEARIEFAHGQMSEHDLERIMVRFLEREIDVLLCTTIIETGIDIPNVNTIFIDECDRFGLAGLHQLRGRVGRSRHKAYCYLILPEHRHVNPDAKKRLQAIREFSQLGAGFQIAMRDLEIRGAGNILGAAQSGHIAVVGYDLYCRLLDRAVKGQHGEKIEEAAEVELDLNLEAYIPEEFVPAKATRLEFYRRLSREKEIEGVEDIAREIEDRSGSLPPPVRRLLEIQIFRILAARQGLHELRFDGESIILRCTESMRPLLDSCPHRVVVLGPEEVAIPLNDPLKKKLHIDFDDVTIFQLVFSWLRDGKFPSNLSSASRGKK